MKRIYKKLLLACSVVLFGLSSCIDLDMEPEGGIFTEDQWDVLLEGSPERAAAAINGLYSGLTQYGSITSWAGSLQHYDFGYAAACMMFDASGIDSPAEFSGYNWFRNNMNLLDRTPTAAPGYFLWNLFYTHLKTANDILVSIPENTENAALKAFRGQALTSRAFDYLHLVQMYQFTYKGNETKPAVPIVTDKTTAEEAGNNPRATVQAVYNLIMDDLNEAVQLLEGFSRANKGIINQNVAYGLRARANLLMQNWSAAAADADKAMAGYTPYSIEDVSEPTFNDIGASSWIWGSIITENNDVVQSGIINFPSHMSSFTGNGYSPGYAARYINSLLWQQIPDTDVRKGWWTDEDDDSPLVDWSWFRTYQGNPYNIAEWLGWNLLEWGAPAASAMKHLNVKFGAYQSIYDNPTNACDIPLMRAEEMHLIKAEGLAMGGDLAAGKTALENFVTTYRDPDFVSTAADAASLQDEVWFQRRVELWGEGFSLFDILRLKKAVTRKGANFPSNMAFDFKAEDPIYLWLIPRDELNMNEGIDESTNNPVIPVPTP